MHSLKCQTPTVSPAEPGDFPFLVKGRQRTLELSREEALAALRRPRQTLSIRVAGLR
jgi:hypothetical protein